MDTEPTIDVVVKSLFHLSDEDTQWAITEGARIHVQATNAFRDWIQEYARGEIRGYAAVLIGLQATLAQLQQVVEAELTDID